MAKLYGIEETNDMPLEMNFCVTGISNYERE